MTAADSEFAAVLTGVFHRYPGEVRDSISAIDLTLRSGERVALIGPSGAGKSTLLSLLDGRLRGFRGGAIVLSNALDARRAPPRNERAKVGFIFQEFALVERASVRENVRNGRLGRVTQMAALFNRFSEADHSAVDRAMADAGILEFSEKRADCLSGGQRQRVAIARCLAQEPQLMLADEPISNLDPLRAEKILQLLGQTVGRRNSTLMFSSHQPVLAMRYADRVIALNNGSIAYDGSPEKLDRVLLAEIYANDKGSDCPSLRLVG